MAPPGRRARAICAVSLRLVSASKWWTIWDRKVIEELFGFSYKWEIYTPVKDRKYGYYVLPILSGDRFIGRIELRRDRKKKKIEQAGLWWEDKAYGSAEMKKRVREKLDGFNKIMY